MLNKTFKKIKHLSWS